MKTYYQITCELYTEHVVPVINAKQYDSGRGVDITLTDCGAVVVPAVSDVCNLYCKKSDGTVSYISGTVNGSAVRVDFTNTLLAEAGVVECELEVTSGADTVSTPVFKMVVLPSNYDQSAIESQDEFTALEDALAQLSNIGPAASYDVANNLTTATAGSYVLDAAQGKALNDKILPLKGLAKNYSTDFDNINEIGIYYTDGTTMSNAPGVTYTYSTLIVTGGDASLRLQTLIHGSYICTRKYYGSPATWRAWYRSNSTDASLSPVGTIISDTLTTATECANGGFLNAVSIGHEAGTYVFFGYVSFASNANGTRSMFIASSASSSSAIVTSARARVAPATGVETTFGCSGIIKATAAGTWYLRVWQNSGGALNVTGAQLTAIKIAD